MEPSGTKLYRNSVSSETPSSIDSNFSIAYLPAPSKRSAVVKPTDKANTASSRTAIFSLEHT